MAKRKLKRLEQLSLNFDDPTAEETIEHQRMAELDVPRKEVISSQNSKLYFHLCNEIGIEPEDKLLYERGFLESQKNLLESQKVAKSDERLSILNNYHIKKSYKDAITLFNYVKQKKINIESPTLEDITKMRQGLINGIGYTKLNGNKGEKVLVTDALPKRLISIYQDYIAKARKIIDIQKRYSLSN